MKIYRELYLHNARTIFIKKIEDYTIDYSEQICNKSLMKKKINSITWNGESITVGDYVKIDKEEFYVNEIVFPDTENKYVSFKIHTSELTKSSVYLLPMLKMSLGELLYTKGGNFFNVFIDDSNPYQLHVIYRTTNLFTKNFNLMKAIKFNKYFIDEHIINEEYEALIFNIDEIYHKDVDLFRESKLSKMSDECKELITKFYRVQKTSPLYGILYKTDFYREFREKQLKMKLPSDCELGQKIDMKKEMVECMYDSIKHLI